MAPKRKYSWEHWFIEGHTTLVRGVDYDCSQSQMIQYIRNKASLLKLRVKLTDSTASVTIRVLGKTNREDYHQGVAVAVSPQFPIPLA